MQKLDSKSIYDRVMLLEQIYVHCNVSDMYKNLPKNITTFTLFKNV